MALRTNTAKWIENANRWQINVQKGGKRKTFTSAKPGRTGQREANAKADAWLEEGLQSRKVKVCDAYIQYLARVEKTTSISNYRPMLSRWVKWIEPRIGGRRLESLTMQSVQDIIDDACAAGLSKKTLKSLMGDLTAFFKYCRRAGQSTFVPDDLHIPESARYKGKTILQPEDLAKLFACDTTTYRGKPAPETHIHLYRLMVLTGLRPGEALGLRWQDVKPDALHLQQAINMFGQITHGKNENARRAVPLSDMAKAELAAQRIETGGQALVFPAISEALLLKHWRIFCEANGIAKVTLYELRHTFVSIAQSLPEAQVKSIVGHSRNMDTFGIYGHKVNGQAEAAATALNDTFKAIL